MAAFFGSQGLYVYDLAGTLKWKRDLGRLDAGAYDDPSYEWGNASSPILYQDLVIVQCDQQKDSFLIALRLSDGEIAWKAPRDEQPSWATPTVFPGSGKGGAELVTNAPKFIRGYDPKSGRELWRLGRSSNITAPTPIFDGDLIVVMSGRRPNAPIFVLKAGARGDITLPEGATSAGSVLWTKERAGLLHADADRLRGPPVRAQEPGHPELLRPAHGRAPLRAAAARRHQRLQRLARGRRRQALPAERGRRDPGRESGPQFALVGRNPMGQALMATPAIAGRMLLVRGERELVAIGGR